MLFGILTLDRTIRSFKEKKFLENNVGKGENTRRGEEILITSTFSFSNIVFNYNWDRFCILATFNISSANLLSLNKVNILSFGKELFTTQSRFLLTLEKKPLENIVRQEDHDGPISLT